MVIIVLISIFFASRFFKLMAMPVFLDETLYIRWLNSIHQSGDWLLPLKEFGWEPLNIWLSVLTNRFISDPLFSLRVTAVFFGFLLLLAVINIGSWKTGLLVIFSPVILLYDRLGLRGDNAVVFFSALVFIGLKQKLINKKNQGIYLASLGIILGLLTKTTAAVLPISTLLSYLIFRPRLNRHDFIAGGLCFLPGLFYWLSGMLTEVVNKKDTFFSLISLGQIKSNLIESLPWFWQYLTWPVCLLAVLGVLVLIWRRHPEIRILLAIWLSSFILIIGFAKIVSPRYWLIIYFFTLVVAGYGWQWLIEKLPKSFRLLTLIFIIPGILFSWQIISQPEKAPLPEIERWQYVTGWPSGYGLKELVEYLKSDQPSVLVTEDNDLIKSGLPYLWPEHPFIITHTATASAYFVSNINNQLPDNLTGRLLKEFPRPGGKSSIKLFHIISIE